MRNEIFIQNNVIEQPMSSNIRWMYVGDGSAYAAEQIRDEIVVGGSVWRRREIPYNKDLARTAEGNIYRLRETDEDVVLVDEDILFPSMVNVVLPHSDETIVCCKHEVKTYNRFDENWNCLQSVDDEVGGGVYLSVLDELSGEIISACRNGQISFSAVDDMSLLSHLRLSDSEVRLWSLCTVSDGLFAAGDYNGNLYFANKEGVQQKIDLSHFADDTVSEEQRKYSPSVFGLSQVSNDKVVAGTRWGQVIWMDDELDVEKVINLPFEISYLTTHPGTGDIFVGTREGSLLRLYDEENSIAVNNVISVSPTLQNDNSIWSISFPSNTSSIVAFADGQIAKINV